MRACVAIFALFALTAAGAGEAETLYKAGGTVRGPGGPLQGATVKIEAFTIDHRPLGELTRVTGADGRFSGELPGGELSIRATPPAGSGLLPLQTGFHLKRDLEMQLTLVAPVKLSGTAAGEDLEVEIRGLLFEPHYTRGVQNGRFEAEVEPGRYSILIRKRGRYYGHAFVDARKGDVSNIEIAQQASPIDIAPDAPPVASRITVSAAGEDGMAVVTGAPGAVSGMGTVLVGNVQTQQIQLAVAEADGSFALPMFAPAGSWLSIKFDRYGRFLPPASNGGNPLLQVSVSTLISVPLPAGSFAAMSWIDYYGGLDDRAFVGQLPIFGYADAGQWRMTGTFDRGQWVPGASVALSGTLTIHSKDLTGVSDVSLTPSASIALERLSSASGIPMQSSHSYMSSIFTPTGIPIEREGASLQLNANFQWSSSRRLSDDRIAIDWTAVVRLPASLPAGIYVPRVNLSIGGMPPHRRHLGILATMGSGPGIGSLPLIRIGPQSNQRLFWVLALDDIANGHRGAIAREDRGLFAFANHVVTPGDVTILPRVDQRTGAAIRYRLEPFAPMTSFGLEGLARSPAVAFRFPSGELHVRVTRPGGAVDDLGRAPFAQTRSRSHATAGGNIISGRDGRNSNHVTDLLQLTTLDPRFEYAFSEYGLHRVELRGWVEDLDGARYDGGGTYEVWIARPLEIEPAVLPGTPFEIGNEVAPVVLVQPPVPADLEMRVRTAPGGIDRTAYGRCNRFGHCRIERFTFPSAGEYRIDMTATYTAPDGTLWKGTATWGSVVETPSSTLTTHGRRGFDFVDHIQEPWFFVREARTGDDHVNFPFHSGDVQWMEQLDPAASGAKISIQDSEGSFAARVRALAPKSGPLEPPSLEQRITAGEIPLFSTTASGLSPSFDPASIDQWGYFYSSVQRPGVRIREMTSEDHSGKGYWRFRDQYQLQHGTGLNGDLPSDFKFQFGGAVHRNAADGFAYYGAYASLFVMVPDGDPDGGRVFPPFQGNGGGASGGPIMRLLGKEIDLFFHPTGVRAGTILHRGEIASFAGYVAPTLPARVEIVITTPSGKQRTIAGRANKIGYFHSRSDLVVDESGVWRMKVTASFDGRTSAGPVSAPFPAGDVLGSRSGEFFFYVVDSDAPPLELAALPRFVRPADGAIAIDAQPPAGLTAVELTHTTTMPGFILEEGASASTRYAYDARTLAASFPNLDLTDPEDGAGADTITISLLLSGTDAAGARKHFARQLVIQGEEVQMPPQDAHVRRRAVRK